MRALAIALATALVNASGCGDPAAGACPADLGARLDGIWEGDARRYHIEELSGGVEIFALDDSRGGLDRPLDPPKGFAGRGRASRPPAKSDDKGNARSASYARLERSGGALRGYGQQFRGEGDRVCRVRWPIAGSCDARGRLVLEIAEPGALDASDCAQAPPGPRRRLVLARVEAL